VAAEGTGVDSSGLPREDQGYPAFAQTELGPITLVTIDSSDTTPKKRGGQITSQ